MVLTAKKKRTITIILVSLLVAVILVGMGIGIYYLITSRETGLSRDQIIFGQYVNSQSLSPESQNLDLANLPEDMDAGDIEMYTDNYIVSFNNVSQGYKIYSRLNHSYVPIESDYAKVLQINGHLAVLDGDGGNLLVNLKDGSLICSLQGVSTYFAGSNVMLRPVQSGVLPLVSEQSEALLLAVYDCDSLERLVEVKAGSDLLDASLTEGYLSLSYSQRTEIYLLDGQAQVIKTFSNVVGEEGTDNIESSFDGTGYYLIEYYHAFAVGNGRFLIERCTLVDGENYTIEKDGNKYLLSYFIYDADKNVELNIANTGILRPVSTSLERYFALVEIGVDQKAEIDENSQTISYYSIETVKKQTTAVKVVSYDYIKQGVIVGFDGEDLITSGGRGSSKITFDGNVHTGYINSSRGERVTMSGYNDAVVLTSVMGQKKILSKDGESGAVDKWFLNISPFDSKSAVAFDGSRYYLVSTSGTMNAIENFATEYADYVFMGLGLYFVNDQDKISVYNFKGEKLYDKVDIKLSLEDDHTVLVKINGQQQEVIKISAQQKYVKSGSTLYPELAQAGRISYAQNVDGAQLVSDATLNEAETNVDQFGVGTAIFNLSVNLDDLQFRALNTLSDTEKALLPSLDSPTGYVVNEIGYYNIVGIYTYTAKNLAVVFVKLEDAIFEHFTYLTIIALKDAYISRIDASSSFSGEQSSLIYFENGTRQQTPFDVSSDVLAAKALTGKSGLYSEMTASSRTINPAIAGYDGAIVLASGEAEKIDLNLTIRNTFVSTGVTSEWIDVSQLEGTHVIDKGHYKFVISRAENVTTAQVVAVNGYIFEKIALSFGQSATSLYEDVAEVATQDGASLVSGYTFTLREDCPYIRLKDSNLIETYYLINLKNDDQSDVETLYHFYGYGSDITTERNPAGLGFDNFYRKETATAASKVGHTFAGYKLGENIMIDENAHYVGVETSFGEVQGFAQFNYVAFFTPNKYKITYESENRPVPAETEVTYGQPVGALFDIATSEHAKVGNDFVGWFTSEQGGEQFDPDQPYLVDGNTRLFARWTPHVSEVMLYSNISNYKGVNVLGFDYNISQITYAEDFGETAAGTTFDETSIQITYGQTYGSLPVLAAIGVNGERYSFAGWFTEGGFSVNDLGVFSRGEQITEQTQVPVNPVLTLYAHFKRDVYSVNVNAYGETLAEKDGSILSLYENLSYTGSDQYGKSGEFSSALGSPNYWEPVRQNRFMAYTLQSSSLTLKAMVGEGYYLSSIVIVSYNLDDTTTSATINGQWNNLDDSFDFSSNTTGAGYTVSSDGNLITISLTALSQAADVDGTLVAADVTLNFATKTYEHIFSLSLDGEGTLGEITGGNIEKEESTFINPQTVYGYTYIYTYSPNAQQTYNGQKVFNNNRLKAFIVGDTTIDFTLSFVKDETLNQWVYLLSSTYGHETEYSASSITQTYRIEGQNYTIVLTISYDTINLVYTYKIAITSYENVEINIEEEAINSSVQVAVSNVGGESSESGIQSQATLDGQNVQGLNQNVRPNSTLVYDFAPNAENYMISSLIIKIGGHEYDIARPLISLSQTVVKISPNFVALSDVFARQSNKITMQGTGLEVEWTSSTNGFKVTITNAVEDVEIKVYSLMFRLLEIGIDSEVGSYFDVQVSSGTLMGQSIKEMEQTSTPSAGKIYSTYNETLGCFCYVIYGSEQSIAEYEVVSLSTASRSYEFSTDVVSRPQSTAQVSADLTKLSCSSANYFTSATLIISSARVSFENYLGVGSDTMEGDQNYELDPLAAIEYPLCRLYVTYYNAEGTSSTIDWQPGNGNVTIYGNTIIFKIYIVEGYTFNRVELMTGQEKLEPTDTSSSSDNNGSYMQFTYVLDDLSIEEYTFKTYQDATLYTIHYVANFDNVTGQTADSYHYYNVFKQLNTCGFEKEGYTFLGWSRTEKTGIDLSQSDVEFTDGQMLTENLSATGGEIYLYAIFAANEYQVSYLYNDSTMGVGSSPASVKSEGVATFKIDHELGTLAELERPGYTFDGWSIVSGDENLLTGEEVLTIDLFGQMTMTNGRVSIYAFWSASTYTILIHPNDLSENYGSTNAEGNLTEVQAVFDSTDLPNVGALTRVGYKFLGYKSVRLTHETAQVDHHTYLFQGEDCLKAVDYTLFTSNAELDIKQSTIEIYAVYEANTYLAYVNLNNRDLQTYGQTDGTFTVTTADGRSASSAYEWMDLYFEVLFDHKLGTLPTIETKGYEFVGFYKIKNSSLTPPDSESPLTKDDVFDVEMLNAVKYSDQNNSYESISDNKFSIYAHYTEMYFNVAVSGDTSGSTQHIAQVDDYTLYSTSALPAQTAQSVSGHYGTDFIVDLVPDDGKYFNKITIRYTDEKGTRQNLIIEFKWDNNKNVTFTCTLAGINQNTTKGSFVRLLGRTSYVIDGLYIKVMQYGQLGRDSCRVILGFDFIKTDFDIVLEESYQMYDVTYYRYTYDYEKFGLESADALLYVRSYEYNHAMTKTDYNYVYTPRFAFQDYYFVSSYTLGQDPRNGTKAIVGERITSNRILVGVYAPSTTTGVEFYFYDEETDSYQYNGDISSQYILSEYVNGQWKNGPNDGTLYSINDGTLLILPSPASSLWPEGTYFAGYVVVPADAPNSGYLSWTKGNAASYVSFDTDYRIEGSIRVYAVYNEIYFNLNVSSTSDGNAEATLDFSLYEYTESGGVRRLTNSDVHYVSLTAEQIEIYSRNLAQTNLKESALIEALGRSTDLTQTNVFTDEPLRLDTNTTTYLFAFIIGQDSKGNTVITLVADQYFGIDHGTITKYDSGI